MARILFVSVSFFDYERRIKLALEKRGYIVDMFDERPSNMILVKGILRLNRRVLNVFLTWHFQRIIAKIKNFSYDYLFIVKGEVIPRDFVEKFIQLNPKAVRLFYTWDSISNNGNPLSFLDLCNNKLTFDPEDSRRYGMDFRPLFFLDEFSKMRGNEGKPNVDVLFLGTIHGDRFVLVRRIFERLYTQGLSTYGYYYVQGVIMLLYWNLLGNNGWISRSEVSFKKLDFKSLLDLMSRSRVILDIHHERQSGLTMRTIEALGAGKKIVTTNKGITNYWFYNPSQFFILDRDNLDFDLNFFAIDYHEERDLYPLSIDGWLDSIFDSKYLNNFWFKK